MLPSFAQFNSKLSPSSKTNIWIRSRFQTTESNKNDNQDDFYLIDPTESRAKRGKQMNSFKFKIATRLLFALKIITNCQLEDIEQEYKEHVKNWNKTKTKTFGNTNNFIQKLHGTGWTGIGVDKTSVLYRGLQQIHDIIKDIHDNDTKCPKAMVHKTWELFKTKACLGTKNWDFYCSDRRGIDDHFVEEFIEHAFELCRYLLSTNNRGEELQRKDDGIKHYIDTNENNQLHYLVELNKLSASIYTKKKDQQKSKPQQVWGFTTKENSKYNRLQKMNNYIKQIYGFVLDRHIAGFSSLAEADAAKADAAKRLEKEKETERKAREAQRVAKKLRKAEKQAMDAKRAVESMEAERILNAKRVKEEAASVAKLKAESEKETLLKAQKKAKRKKECEDDSMCIWDSDDYCDSEDCEDY